MWLYTPYFGYYAFNAFLGIIMVLNLFWSYTILKMAYKMNTDGNVKQDDRSDAEEYSDDADESNTTGDERKKRK